MGPAPRDGVPTPKRRSLNQGGAVTVDAVDVLLGVSGQGLVGAPRRSLESDTLGRFSASLTPQGPSARSHSSQQPGPSRQISDWHRRRQMVLITFRPARFGPRANRSKRAPLTPSPGLGWWATLFINHWILSRPGPDLCTVPKVSTISRCMWRARDSKI